MAHRSAVASLLVLLGLVAVLLTGCGGDKRRGETEQTEATNRPSAAATESPPATSGERPQVTRVTDPARRAYVRRVDAVCRQIEPERTKEQDRVGSATEPDEAVKAYEAGIGLGRRELRRIEAIAEPPGDAALLKANVFDPIKSQLALRARIRDALAAADMPLLRRLRTELDNSTRTLTGFARGYGFRVCGEE